MGNSKSPKPVFLSAAGGSNATKGKSKDPEDDSYIPADSGSSHENRPRLFSLYYTYVIASKNHRED